ncbi:MAG: hypothetical protein EHM89_01345 [Acidobacteria bacterium]|nr:MAG: hypothetical protein EHM89_01345 [Acidobacteriota bacterium]
MLMRHVGRLFGTRAFDYYLGGIVISWLAFLLAMAVLHRLALLDVSQQDADRAVLYAAIFPFAFFYGVVYTESLFLLLAITAFYGFRTKRWLLGALAGALVGATRPNGVLIWPALAFIVWQTVREDRSSRWRAAVALFVVPAGFMAYGWYNYLLTGSWLEWYAALQRWGYEPGSNSFTAYVEFGRALATRPFEYLVADRNAPYDLLNAGAAALAVTAIPFVWRRLGAAYALFMGINLYVPLSTGQFEGLGRYSAVLFPMFIWLSTLHWPILQHTLVAGFAMLYVLCLALFVNIHPIF